MISDVGESKIIEKLKVLKGRAAVANSHIIYKTYVDIFSSQQFRQLEERGAVLQRLLWGSTSTKNSAYSDIKYVAELIGRNTVNTIPEKTLEAFLDHGEVKETLGFDISSAQQVIDELYKLGIEINEVCSQLLSDGVGAFQKSFDSLLQTIESKKAGVSKKS
jgi:transaldolase